MAKETVVSFLPMEAVGENGELDLSQNREIGAVGNGYTYLRDGDVAYAKITPCFENGKAAEMAGLTEGIAFGTTELTVLRPKPDKCFGRFLYWVIKSPEFSISGEATMTGAGGQKRVPDNFARNFEIACPPLPEQRAIAGFLDRETAKIDALVEEQRRLIALLKEKRQAVISHAVTKGLDPAAPTKPSGIDWLGDIPAHWKVAPLKRGVVSFEQGWSPQCENRPADDGEHGVLKVGCVNGGVFRREENKALPPDLETREGLNLLQGDLLISRANTRDLVGSAAIVPVDEPNLILCDKLYRLRLDPAALLPSFVCMQLGTRLARQEIELEATGASASMVNIGQSVISELRLPVPDIAEQEQIVHHVAEQTENLDNLTAEATRAISLLQERRSALISAAVTGKIDVRDTMIDSTEAA
ncbi:restriction endonuclease subunit S [Mameliella alba]|uniref:restriction endonuclease subunit S n=1 Tax=Mameliella alba TaxID=561184 RepID=UPI00142FDCBA|nr:restriction endonuclease subunit S [Mameliella alba]